MKQVVKSVAVVLAIVFVVSALVAAGLFGIGILLRGADKCSYQEVDRLPSPTGRLAVVRTQRFCLSDEDTPPTFFALLPLGAPFDEKKAFLKSSDYDLKSSNYDGVRSSLGIFAKWLDDDNVLVAAPEGALLKKAVSEFNGIHIQYAVYPLDPGTTRNDNRKKVTEKRIIFEPSFGVNNGVGVPGIGCLLNVNTFDGEHLDELSLDLSARTTFAVKAFDAQRGTVLNKAYSSYDFQISARDEIARPDNHATGAEVIGFTPKDGKSRLWTYVVFPPGVKQPNGKPMAKWIFGYTPTDPHDIISIAEELKSGSLTIRVGYWLDDDVVVYSMGRPTDPQTIDKFEQCIIDNRIFDTPLHGESRK